MSKETSTDKIVKRSQDVQELEMSKGKSSSGKQKRLINIHLP